jgi:hypothetical protein
VLNQVLLPNPLHFLQNNKVFVAGSNVRAANQGEQNVLPFYFRYNPGSDRYHFDAASIHGGYATNVESVVAVHWTQVPNRGANLAAGSFAAIRGVELSGAHIMVTTQFTGCAFCMKEVGGVMYRAHIAPHVPGVSPAMPPLNLARQLTGVVPGVVGGNFSNAVGGAAFRVYGRDWGSPPFQGGYTFGGAQGGSDTCMTVLGVLGGSCYEIYSQTTRNGVITEARRVI